MANKVPMSLHPDYYHLSLVGRYQYAKHVVALMRLTTGRWPNPSTVRSFSFLLLQRSILGQAHEDVKTMIKWEDYK